MSIDLGALADRFVACFPKLNEEGRRVFVALYRELSLGEPVASQQVAQRAGVSLHRVNVLLDAVPAVYRRTLYTWCAWDALFIPMIVAKTAYVESEDAHTGAPIRLTVAPDRVLLSLEDAFELGRRTNQLRYGEALGARGRRRIVHRSARGAPESEAT